MRLALEGPIKTNSKEADDWFVCLGPLVISLFKILRFPLVVPFYPVNDNGPSEEYVN